MLPPCEHTTYVETCRVCHVFKNDPRYKRLWTDTTEQVVDKSVIGNTRHLLYHIYPVGDWRWNITELLKRIDLFNGTRAVAVALDNKSAKMHEVVDAFGATNVEFLPFNNVPNLREVHTFEQLFSRVADCIDPEDVTLYAHAKGVTRPVQGCCRRWTEVLHEVCMDVWPRVKQSLMEYPITSAFKKVGVGWPINESRSKWHYSGAWHWFRNRDLFCKKDWRRIDRFWSGIESYPSLHFDKSQAGVLLLEGVIPTLNLYHDKYWESTVEPALIKWRLQDMKLEYGNP